MPNPFPNPGAVPGPLRDVVGYNGKPPKVTWPGGARIAISLVVNYEEGSELAVGDGDTSTERGLSESAVRPWPDGKRDLAMETMYEYGARSGFWRLMSIFDELDVKSTFYVCALALERNAKAAREIRGRGHDVVCHGYRWEDVTLLTREQEREHIRLAVASIIETTGERPLGWYCRYGPSVHTRELVLEEGGFVYDSDVYNDDLPYYVDVGAKKQLVVPYSMTYNDAKFSLPPSVGSPADFLDNLKRGYDTLWEEGATHPKMMSVGLHPRLIGQASRIHALREFIDYVQKKGGSWIARRIDIARWWREHDASFLR